MWPWRGHTHSFQISGWGCQILPWSWESRSCLIGISKGDRYRIGISSVNHQEEWMARMRLRVGDGHHSRPHPAQNCRNQLDGWKHVQPHVQPRVSERIYTQRCRGTQGEPKWALGWLLRCKEVHFHFCRTNPNSGLLFDGSTSTPPTWASVSKESWLRGSRLLGCEPLSRRGTCPEPKGGDGVHTWLGCMTMNPLVIYMGYYPHVVCPDNHMTPPEWGEKVNQCQEDGSQLQAFYVPVQTLHAGLPLKTTPQPVKNASIVTIWRRWIAPILNTLWRKRGSHQIKRVRKQLCDTLTSRVAGPVEWTPESLIHQMNGLMWSNPRGSSGEAVAMRPKSLWQVLTETWWYSLKRAKHVLRLEIRAGARWACIWTETKWTTKNTVCWEENTLLGVHSEAQSTNVAEDDIPVTAHWLPVVGQNEPIVQIIKYTNALEPQRGQSSIHALCERPQCQSQAKGKNLVLVSLPSKSEPKELPVLPNYLNKKIGIFLVNSDKPVSHSNRWHNSLQHQHFELHFVKGEVQMTQV